MIVLRNRIEDFVNSINFLWSIEPLHSDLTETIGKLVTSHLDKVNENLERSKSQ